SAASRRRSLAWLTGRRMRMLVLRRRYKGFRLQVSAMAGPTSHFPFALVHHAHVVLVNVVGHLEHEPGGFLLRLRVIGEFEHRPAVRPLLAGIGGMAGVAMHAQ